MTSTNLTTGDLLRVDEVAALLGGVKPGTVRDWTRDGRLRGTHLSPRVLRWHRDDVAAFVHKQRHRGDHC